MGETVRSARTALLNNYLDMNQSTTSSSTTTTTTMNRRPNAPVPATIATASATEEESEETGEQDESDEYNGLAATTTTTVSLSAISAVTTSTNSISAAGLKQCVSFAQPVEEWSCESVAQWLAINDLAVYIDAFLDREIDGEKLIAMDTSKLKVRMSFK